MSEVITEAVAALNRKMAGAGFDGTAKFVIPGEGAILIDANGATASDAEADVTLTASADVFRAILEGDQSPTVAFMTGKLTVDGNMGLALKLSSVLG
jgi:putative sterol carrier protein